MLSSTSAALFARIQIGSTWLPCSYKLPQPTEPTTSSSLIEIQRYHYARTNQHLLNIKQQWSDRIPIIQTVYQLKYILEEVS